VASLTRSAVEPVAEGSPVEGGRAVLDSLIVTLGGQVERAFGTVTALMLRWWLDPAQLGIYSGLRLWLDNTNRSSLGVGLGAVQEIPILRAEGRFDEAKRIGDIAHTTNTISCLIYSAFLITFACFHANTLPVEWTWGLVAIAGLALLKRYESFLIAVLRAYQEFELTTKLDVFESLVSIVAVGLGLGLAGFWGLLASVGIIITSKIAFLHLFHPLRFNWAWDGPSVARLMKVGLPILANTAAFGAVLSLDRVLILWRVADPDRALGLYTIAIMGTSWSLDLAGRIVTVMYTYFQTTLGRTKDEAEVARQAIRATEGQAPLLASGCAVAYLVGPTFLGILMPRFVDGLPALRPLLAGTLLLGLAWPARQMLITIGRPYTLALATLAGLILATLFGSIGADRAGIVGVAWGMTLGYASVAWLTGAAASVPILGWRPWWTHQARLARILIGFALATLLTAHLPLGLSDGWTDLAIRCLILGAWLLPTLWAWGSRHDWGGFDRAKRLRFVSRLVARWRGHQSGM
jgi:O-antigen/teichoic acid export membrane protein